MTVEEAKNLAAAIVAQAVVDWRKLIAGKKPTKECNYIELRNFFRSEYCELLLLPFPSITGKQILKLLQEELKDAHNKS